jgi:arabinan endo-1,5-alpha-L-arabinosidase
MRTTYINPVYEADFADIGLLKRPEGYYAYASQGDVDGTMHNIQCLYSTDLVHWKRRDDALPEKAPWATAQDYWAPDVVQLADDDYRMFFNAEVNGSGQGIGVAAATRPEGPFVVLGAPLIHGEKYINIDAKAFQNPRDEKWYLLWGSCFEPIKIQELNADLTGFKNPAEQPIALLTPNPTDENTFLYEAAWMNARVDPESGQLYFYLYTSGPDAFDDETYTVQIARSSEGPLSGFKTLSEETGKPDSIIYTSNEKFLNPGASALTVDDDGQEWLVSHAVLRADLPLYDALKKSPEDLWRALRYVRRVLIIDAIRYKDGWPVINGGSPSVIAQAAPATKANKTQNVSSHTSGTTHEAAVVGDPERATPVPAL